MNTDIKDTHSSYRLFIGLCLWVVLFTTTYVYWPGLNGGFFLDDYPNLEQLSGVNSQSLHDVLLYSLNGFSGAGGRPLSLITFALQAGDWPTSPASFKYVNLVIHLVNGCLIFILLRSLIRLSTQSHKFIDFAALLGTTLWLLNPIQISTVLYAVQRMTELSTTFTLLSLIGYIAARQSLTHNPYRSYLGMSVAISGGILFGVLSKENAILIPLYILLIESILFPSHDKHQLNRTWKIIFIYLPIILAAGYLISKFPSFADSYKTREFTLTERLLTEAVIVTHYAWISILPTPSAFGLYHDDFPISSGLLSPPTTLIAVLYTISIITVALLIRRRQRLISLGILLFYAGHILESTAIPLELYFEHRNYFPLLGIILVLVGLYRLLQQHLISQKLKVFVYVAITTYTLIPISISAHETKLWGNSRDAALLWAEEKPLSARAQADAASLMLKLNQPEMALSYLKKIIKIAPDDLTPYIQWLRATCYFPDMEPPQLDSILTTASRSSISLGALGILNTIVAAQEEGECSNIGKDDIRKILEALLNNPAYQVRHTYLTMTLASLEAGQQNYMTALNLSQQALSATPDIQIALQQLKWLSLAGQYQAAYTRLDAVEEINSRNWKTGFLWERRINEWREFLKDNINKEQRQ